jgi:hypothetical protein
MAGRALKDGQQARARWLDCSWLWVICVFGPVEIPLSGRTDLRTDDIVQQTTGIPYGVGGSNVVAEAIWQV